jgi:hypothetical protein
MKKALGLAGVLALGLGLAIASPAHAAETKTETLYVPQDFVTSLSDTRSTGHVKLEEGGLHIWTEGNAGTDKAAEYFAADVALSEVGEPSLQLKVLTGEKVPGFQLVVDFDSDGTADGILVGEPGVYGNDWWVNNGAAQFVKDAAPSHAGGSGSPNHGTLDEWRSAFPEAEVVAFGFSLGSGVKGDVLLTSITVGDTLYTFAKYVKLESKDECKSEGWATSTVPVFKNQGACVSFFASAKKK